MQAETDADNIASQRILLKCGFTLVETIVDGFQSPILGLRDTLVYKIARPGMTLEGLGQVEKARRWLEITGRAGPGKSVTVGCENGEDEFVPPVQ